MTISASGRYVTPSPYDGQAPTSTVASAPIAAKLVREPRLADPGRADDGHRAALPLGLDGGERAAQSAELTRAADERARVRPGGSASAPRAAMRRRAARPARRGRPARARRGRADLTVRGGVLEPGGDRERAARREPRSPRAGADEHLAGLDAELQCQLELGPGRAHLDRGADRAQRVVFAHLGLAEDAHDRVAGVALDGAAVAFDHCAAGVGVAIEQLVHGLWVEPFGQRARAGDVGDDDAHRRRAGGASGGGGASSTTGTAAAVMASAGSCARIARSSSRSRSPGSIPSSSTSWLRASW